MTKRYITANPSGKKHSARLTNNKSNINTEYPCFECNVLNLVGLEVFHLVLDSKTWRNYYWGSLARASIEAEPEIESKLTGIC